MRISDWSSDVCSSDLNQIQERCEGGRLPCKNRTLSRSIPRSRPWIVRLRRDDGQHRRPYPPKTDVKLNMNDNEPKNQRVAKTVLTLTMLHPVDLDPSQMSEADIAYHLGEGEFIGVRTSIETTAIADEDVGAELQKVGGEPSYFEIEKPSPLTR